LLSPLSHSAVESSVDRRNVALGDTLQLVISATEDDEDLSTVDFSKLEQDFQVLSRSTRSNTSIINGRRTHERRLQVEITPLRTGLLSIPAFNVGTARTAPLQVRVSDAPQVEPGDESVLFEATVDRDSVYVQGQVLLTLRLQQAVNLDDRSISELSLPDAFVVPLEQKSFQRRINGRAWLVHEVRYAIFPEQSGTLTIPAQRFSARESVQRRSLFDSNRGRLLKLRTEPLQIEVLPKPAEFTGNSWLPARNLVVEEDWSADASTLRVGESITRTVRLRGEGVQGAQLPPVQFPDIDGIKHYPDQPSIGDDEISSGLLGSRSDSVAIVATRPGEIEIPAVSIPWWDTDARVMREAVIPARTLQIAPAAAEPLQSPPAQPMSNDAGEQVASAAGRSALPWQLLALFCALGWATTVFVWWRSRQMTPASAAPEQAAGNVKAAYKSLLAACASDQPAEARKALIRWAAARAEDPGITSLRAATSAMDDSELQVEVEKLERALYGSATGDWRGERLRAVVEQLQTRKRTVNSSADQSLQLYPAN